MTLISQQGVVTSVTSLVMAMAQDNLPAFQACYQKAVDRLYRVRTASSRARDLCADLASAK
jgi:hypothetical protein